MYRIQTAVLIVCLFVLYGFLYPALYARTHRMSYYQNFNLNLIPPDKLEFTFYKEGVYLSFAKL